MAKEKDDKFDPKEIGKIVDSITGLGKISKKEGKKIKKNLGLVGDAIKQLPAEGEIKVQLEGVGGLVDSMVKLGESSKKHAKKSAKNLDLIRDSVGKFAKGLKGKDITNVTDSFDTFADGLVKLGTVGWRQKKRITGTLDAVGISLKKFSNNEGVKTSADGLESMTDSITKLSLIGRRKRKGIVKDLTKIGSAFGLSAGAVGKGGSALALKEKTKEASQAKSKAQQRRLNMFSMLGGKLDELIGLSPKKEKKGLLAGLKGMFKGLPGLLGLAKGGIGGLFGLAKSPLGLAIGAALGGWFVGKKLFDSWLGPLMTKSFHEGQEKAAAAESTTQVGSVLITDEGKEVKLYKVAGKLMREEEAEALAKAGGFGSLEAATKAEDSGFHRATAGVNTATGADVMGQAQYTEADLGARQAGDVARAELKEAVGKGAEGSRRQDQIWKAAQTVKKFENDLLSISSGTYADETETEKQEKGAEDLIGRTNAIWEDHMSRAGGKGGMTKSDVRKIWAAFPMSNIAKEKGFGSVWSGASEAGGGFFGINNTRVKIQARGPGEVMGHMLLGQEYLKRYGQVGSLFKPENFGLDPRLKLMQEGGLVQKATMALLHKDETVVPLEKAPQFIANVLAKTINTLGNQQVGMQNALASLSSTVGGGGAPQNRNTNINTVISNKTETYQSPPMIVHDETGIQKLLAG